MPPLLHPLQAGAHATSHCCCLPMQGAFSVLKDLQAALESRKGSVVPAVVDAGRRLALFEALNVSGV